ncbi:MAG: alkaline phosphatase, partial [Thermodesulfobacteriota bacterium]
PCPPSTDPVRIKNVIVMIGDGMGFQQVGLLVAYAHQAPHSVYQPRGGRTALESVMEAGTLGVACNEPADALVTDSAASSTQMASGEWAGVQMIGIDKDGNAVKTILEIAEEMGKSTGLVTDTAITHATPAAFAAHQTHRSKQDKIAVDLLEAGVDVMLAGGLEWWIPQEANDRTSETYRELAERTGGAVEIRSIRNDGRDLIKEAGTRGLSLCFNRTQLDKASGDRVLGLFAPDALPNGIRETRTREDPGRTVPTLSEMTAKALDILSRNPKGFFLMVEGGLIDWAGHDNDAGTLLHEMIKFDKAVALVHEWAKGRQDTLVLVTADHETGGFGFSYSRLDLPAPRTLPGSAFKGEIFQPRRNFGNHRILDAIYDQKLSYPEIMERFDALPEARQTPKALAEIIETNTEFPITEAEATTVLGGETDDTGFYGRGKEFRRNLLARIVSKRQLTVWATGSHTNTPLPLIVYGPSHVSSRYGKMMHTTEWGRETIDILKNHIFNWMIWPDFTQVPSPEAPFMRYAEIELGRTESLD